MLPDIINPILKCDSYKDTHHKQYPPRTTELLTYIESRGGPTDGMLFFGLQMFTKELEALTITSKMVVNANDFVDKHIGPGIFPRADWDYVVDVHKGKIPVEICAAPEGAYIPNHNVMVTCRSTDERLFWMTSWIETQLLRAVWYPTTVATTSFNIKKLIYKYLLKTSDDADGQINFKLHDFGARGVSSSESACIGGAAHLASFMGSDTQEGIMYANYFYGADMAAFSIPASEHSTITTWGKDREVDAYRNILQAYPGATIIACVSDSYDLFNAVDNIWGSVLKEEVVTSGKVLVVRPDSGTPHQVVLEVVARLDAKFGSTVNSKGYKVLANCVRVIQGDGININSIEKILSTLDDAGYAADNIAFGMGGALLQAPMRDDYKFADKCCLAMVDGVYIPVFKDPATDPGKRSKSGNLDLVKYGHGYQTIDRLQLTETTKFIADPTTVPSELLLVYRNGICYNTTLLHVVRTLVDHALKQQLLCQEHAVA